MPTTCSTYSGTCLILSLRLKNPRRPPAGIRGGITNNMQTPRTDTRGRNVGAREPSVGLRDGGQIVKYLFYTFREFLFLPGIVRIPPCGQRPGIPL
jgi:hypothetical protein